MNKQPSQRLGDFSVQVDLQTIFIIVYRPLVISMLYYHGNDPLFPPHVYSALLKVCTTILVIGGILLFQHIPHQQRPFQIQLDWIQQQQQYNDQPQASEKSMIQSLFRNWQFVESINIPGNCLVAGENNSLSLSKCPETARFGKKNVFEMLDGVIWKLSGDRSTLKTYRRKGNVCLSPLLDQEASLVKCLETLSMSDKVQWIIDAKYHLRVFHNDKVGCLRVSREPSSKAQISSEICYSIRSPEGSEVQFRLVGIDEWLQRVV